MNEFQKQVLALKGEATYWAHRAAYWLIPLGTFVLAWFWFAIL